MSITSHLADIMLLLGVTPERAAADADLPPRRVRAAMAGGHIDLDALEAILAPLGMRLAIVPSDLPPVQLSSKWLIEAVIRRALSAGESEYALQARVARLAEVDPSAITRALRGSELRDAARGRLEAHLRDPVGEPLPPSEAHLSGWPEGVGRERPNGPAARKVER